MATKTPEPQENKEATKESAAATRAQTVDREAEDSKTPAAATSQATTRTANQRQVGDAPARSAARQTAKGMPSQAPPPPFGNRAVADDGSPLLLVDADETLDSRIARADVGWVRPVGKPAEMPGDVSEWLGFQFAMTSARDNFDRVVILPGTVAMTAVDVFDAETLEEERTLGIGEEADKAYVPCHYVDRRKRALQLRVYDVAVPESIAYRTEEQAAGATR